MSYYLSIDCESGGAADDKSLLSVFLGFHLNDFTLIKELNLLVKPDDGNYLVDAQGLSVNKIDLINHDTYATTYKKAGSLIYTFLDECHQSMSLGYNDLGKLIPVGHGVIGDIKKIQANLVSKGTWDSFVSYTPLDTSSVCQLLKHKDLIPTNISNSVEALANHFDVTGKIAGNFHEARYDALVTVEILKKMLELL